MTMTQIAYFYALSECKSFSQAANQLYITQPALSKSIAALEKELNLELLVRDTRHVHLTAAGYEYAKTCKEILQIHKTGINNARAITDDFSGQVRFGLPSERVCQPFVRLKQKLSETYPNLKIDVKFYSENGLLRALDNHTADFVIAFGEPRSDNVHRIVLTSGSNCAVLPKNHRLSGRSSVTMPELKFEDFISLSYRVSGADFDRVVKAAKDHNFSPHLVYEAESISTLVTLIGMGNGISILPEAYKGAVGNYVSFVPIENMEQSQEKLMWLPEVDSCQQAIIDFVVYNFEQIREENGDRNGI